MAISAKAFAETSAVASASSCAAIRATASFTAEAGVAVSFDASAAFVFTACAPKPATVFDPKLLVSPEEAPASDSAPVESCSLPLRICTTACDGLPDARVTLAPCESVFP